MQWASTCRQQHEAEQRDVQKGLGRASLAFCHGAAGLQCLLAPMAVEPAEDVCMLFWQQEHAMLESGSAVAFNVELYGGGIPAACQVQQ